MKFKTCPLIAALVIFYSINIYSANGPLPNWIDKSREVSDGKEPIIYSDKETLPSDFKIPAEYEPISAVVISWAGYTNMLTQIAKAACEKANAKVWILSAPQSISGLSSSCWQKISAPVDSVWVRDYGPFGISTKTMKPGIIDTTYRHYQYRRNDDAAPYNIGKSQNIPVYSAKIILDGGNFMIDSYGNLFTTYRTYIWNSNMSKDQVDSILKEYFKAKNIYVFEYAGYPDEPKDGTGHIDMFMKLINDHTVLISTADKEPFKSNGEKAIAFFKNKTAPDGIPYKVITVKGWYDESGYYSGTWYTYTNSLIVNGTVIMPAYSGHEEENNKAEQAYRQADNSINVVKVYSDDSITSGGSIHCITQTIPKYVQKNKIFTNDNESDINTDIYIQRSQTKTDDLIEKLSKFKF